MNDGSAKSEFMIGDEMERLRIGPAAARAVRAANVRETLPSMVKNGLANERVEKIGPLISVH